LSGSLPAGPPFWKLANLTPREQEILECLSRGDLLKEIADQLGISNWTVQGHVKRIFEKLKVHTRTEAVIKYLQK
jgi:DNA-binding NarL/FixJ family response regulator